MGKYRFTNYQWNKYNARKVSHAGRSFDSKLEADVFDMLYLMEKGGLIKDIHQHAAVKLTDAEIVYYADFKVWNIETNCHEWHEAKGFETPVWRIKRRLWKAGYGPGKLIVWVRSGKSINIKEEVIPKTGGNYG